MAREVTEELQHKENFGLPRTKLTDEVEAHPTKPNSSKLKKNVQL